MSIAGKFGMRQEEIPALLQLARMWVGKSVDDLGHKYETDGPRLRDQGSDHAAIVCMFDSGYTLPQGREVINYYYPLQYGFDGIIAMAREMKAKVAGRADGDGLTGMNRLYNYEAVILAPRGRPGLDPQLRQGGPPAGGDREGRPAQKQEYTEIAERLEWLAHGPPRTFREAIQIDRDRSTWPCSTRTPSPGMSPGRIGQVLCP